jgi:hypothetical protein
MPPVTQQGSRAGLITAVVIFTILFVISTIFAIYFGVELSSARDDIEAMEAQYRDVVARAALTAPEVRQLTELRTDPESGFTREMTALDIAMAQRNRLARVITGANTSAAEARQVAERAMTDASNRVREAQVTLPAGGENLAGAVQTLSNAVVTQYTENRGLARQLETTNQELVQTNQRLEEALAAKDQQIQQVRQQTEQAVQLASAGRTSAQEVVQAIEQAREQERRIAQEAQNQLQVQFATMQRENQRLQTELEDTRARFLGRRVAVGESVIRQADGRILRAPGAGIVVIDLGFGDQLSPGLTFEVYDRAQGVPPLGQEQDDLPQGKASIEVIRVGPASSEARIIQQRPGTTLMEGDLIVNLVYDRRTSYNFLVFGRFDITQTGRPTHQDAELVRRLIEQWGGRVVDEVNVQTDFLVIGAEPQLPEIDPDDPIERQRYAEAQAELEQYYEVLSQARDLHIPVLNQNRFLYFTGYYSQARR